LILTPHIERYLAFHDGINMQDANAIRLITKQLKAAPRDRSASFSASSRGSCLRAQMFGYIGMPDSPASVRLRGIFMDGHWRHLKWQALLLEAGLLNSIEYPLLHKPWRMRGTVDGLYTPDYGLEIKGNTGAQQLRGQQQAAPDSTGV
jgi:hypothetical protein